MELFLNRVWATLASGMDASQTSMPLTTGHGARFGTIAAGDKVRIDLLDATLNVSETVYATARSGDTLTVIRAQDGSAAAVHLAGDRLEARIGKSTMESLMQPVDIQNGAETLLGSVTGTNTIAAAANPTLIAQAATGSLWKLPAAGANTGATTLNIDGMGAVAVVRPDDTALQADDIPAAGYMCLFEKTATDFVLLNPSTLHAQAMAQVATQSKSDMQKQSGVAYTTGGTDTAFTLTPVPAIAANAVDIEFDVVFHVAPGASSTLAVSGKAALPLKWRDSIGGLQAITDAQVPLGWRAKVVNDGTNWVVREVAGPEDEAAGTNYFPILSVNVAEVVANYKESTVNAWTEVMNGRVLRNGTYRFAFKQRASSAGAPSYARIYKNGVAFGTQRNTSSTAYADAPTEDLAFSAGDTVQMFVLPYTTTHTVGVSSFRMGVAMTGGKIASPCVQSINIGER